MHRVIILTIFVYTLLAISDVSTQDAMLAPPVRPSTFTSPDQLRGYLKALNEYYAIVGRPRFGKRTYERRSLMDALLSSGYSNEE